MPWRAVFLRGGREVARKRTMDIQKTIRSIPNFPKPGIIFRDITTLLGNPRAFRCAVDELVQPYAGTRIDKVAGIEARGFILGGAVAHQLSTGFLPVRKKGRLPWRTLGQEYTLEYGTDAIEIHEDAIRPGDRVLIVDDLIATGGTAEAAVKLIEKAGGEVIGLSFVIDLPALGGSARLRGMGKTVHVLCAFEGA
jgi:adenine phosphoribosyltransferase